MDKKSMVRREDEGKTTAKTPQLNTGESTTSHDHQVIVRKLDLSHLCFSLNFYFPMLLRLFPSMFPLLTYSQSFLSLIC